jgi:DNA-binding response OmpR family regulator
MKRILVIDDDPQFRGYMATLLRKRGFEVVEADGGRKAIELARGTPVDLVITDIVMPDMEGLETIRRIQAGSQGAKIVAISGGGSGRMDYLRFAQDLGADATLKKPFSPSELMALINRLLAD